MKGEFNPRTDHEGTEGERRYVSTLSLTSALDGGGWLTTRPDRFTPGKETRYPFYGRLGGPQCQSGRVTKISPALGFDPRTGHPIASRYTDYAIPALSSALLMEILVVFLRLSKLIRSQYLKSGQESHVCLVYYKLQIHRSSHGYEYEGIVL